MSIFLVTYVRKTLSSFQTSIHIHAPVHQSFVVNIGRSAAKKKFILGQVLKRTTCDVRLHRAN